MLSQIPPGPRTASKNGYFGHLGTVPDRLPSDFTVGSVGSVSASRTVGREFASRPGHTKDQNKNGTNCLPA